MRDQQGLEGIVARQAVHAFNPVEERARLFGHHGVALNVGLSGRMPARHGQRRDIHTPLDGEQVSIDCGAQVVKTVPIAKLGNRSVNLAKKEQAYRDQAFLDLALAIGVVSLPIPAASTMDRGGIEEIADQSGWTLAARPDVLVGFLCL